MLMDGKKRKRYLFMKLLHFSRHRIILSEMPVIAQKDVRTTKRCKCIQNKIKCSTDCHGSKPCHNKLKEDIDVVPNECEIPHKISDHEEVNQKQSSCSSSEYIATYNIISI